MQLKFWGTRGSNPVAYNDSNLRALFRDTIVQCRESGVSSLDDLLKFLDRPELPYPITYGGNTPCVELRQGDQSLIVDMGTGLREAGTLHFGRRKEFIIFLTHLHWDHLIGLPFFLPVFAPGHRLIIYHVHKSAPDSIRNLFNGINFPLTFNMLRSEFEFRKLEPYETVTHDEFDVTPFVLDHPGGCYGYRFESKGTSAAIGFDGSYTRVSRKDMGADLRFYQNLDILVFDAQYAMEELMNKFDWGHCAPNVGIDLALREGIKALALIHHDPWATRSKIRVAHDEAMEYLRDQTSRLPADWPHRDRGVPKLYSAYDGLEIDISKKGSQATRSPLPSQPC